MLCGCWIRRDAGTVLQRSAHIEPRIHHFRPMLWGLHLQPPQVHVLRRRRHRYSLRLVRIFVCTIDVSQISDIEHLMLKQRNA